jgi:hypothetical protein
MADLHQQNVVSRRGEKETIAQEDEPSSSMRIPLCILLLPEVERDCGERESGGWRGMPLRRERVRRERADSWETVVKKKGERLPEFAHVRGGSRKMGMRMQHRIVDIASLVCACSMGCSLLLETV